MRRLQNVRTQCVDAQTIHNYFSKMADAITSGCQKVWVSTNPETGEVSFYIGKRQIRVNNSNLIQEGGIL